MLVGGVFVIVVVEEFAACRCIFLCKFKCQWNIGLIAVNFYPGGLSVYFVVGTSRTNGAGIGSGFVDNVPCIEGYIRVIFCQCFHDNLDIIFQTLGHLFLGYPGTIGVKVFLEEPVRSLTVPYQNVTTNWNLIGSCKFQHFICFVERNLRCSIVSRFLDISLR